jgi:hypothetical protein
MPSMEETKTPHGTVEKIIDSVSATFNPTSLAL